MSDGWIALKPLARSWLATVLATSLALAACQQAVPATGGGSPGSTGPSAEKTYEWRMNISHPPGDIKTKYAEEFAKLVQDRSNGRIKFLTFPGSTLMSSEDSAKETSSGTLKIDANGPNFYEPIVPFMRLLSVPFVGLDMTDIRRIISPGTRGREIVDKALATANLKLIALWDAGTLGLVTQESLNTVASLKGKSIRASGQVTAACLRAVGGSVVTMSGTEAVDAMRRHIIAGSTIEVASIKTRGYDAFAKYWVDWRIQPAGLGIFMNLGEWEALPSDLQGIVLEVAKDVEERADAASLAEQQGDQAILEKGGMTFVEVDATQRAELRAACQKDIDAGIAQMTPADLVHEFKGLMDAEAKRLGR
jgi:TRAP-type C4-dicarboxylate transport system substrate-binding protein